MQSLAGRKPKPVMQTFVLYDEDVRPVKPLLGFSRIQSAMCSHLPLVQKGDVIEFRMVSERLNGRSRVLDYKHADTREGRMTLLAIQMIEGDDMEEDGD